MLAESLAGLFAIKADDLVVTDPAGAVQVLGTDYEVTGSLRTGAGSIRALRAYEAGVTLTATRVTERVQEAAIPVGQPLPSKAIERELDRRALVEQELDADAAVLESRALRVPVGESIAALSASAARAGKVLFFDAVTGQPNPRSVASLPTVKGDPGDLTPAAQATLDAAQMLLAQVSALAQIASTPPAYDPLVEFSGGVVGGVHYPQQQYLFQDLAGTVPVTATGQTVAVMLNRQGNVDYDYIQPNAAKRPTYFEAYGLGFLRFTNGKFMYSRANVPLSCPMFMAISASFAGTTGRALMGFAKNTGSRLQILSGALDAIEAAIDGTSDIAGRTPAVRANAADFSCPDGGIVSVYHSLAKAGQIDAVFEDSALRDGIIQLPTAWANGDSIAGMSLVLNGSSQSLGVGQGNADASMDYYGSVVMSKEPVSRTGCVAALQALSRPQPTVADRIIVCLNDSLFDNEGTDIAQYEDEGVTRFARDHLVGLFPTDCVLQRDWCRDGDTLRGYARHSSGTLTKRTFVFNLSSAGCFTDFFVGERFARALAWLPKVDVFYVQYGHNALVQDATLKAHAQVALYRKGAFVSLLDKLRAAFPMARFNLGRAHPLKTPGNTDVNGVVAAVDNVAASYGDITLVDHFERWETAGRPAGWYVAADTIHASPGIGSVQHALEMAEAWSAMPPLANPTPPLIAQRRIPYGDNLLSNGGFEMMTGAMPTGCTVTGNHVAVRSNERIGRGQTIKVTGSTGDFRLPPVNAVPLRGQTVVLTLVANILSGSNLEAGGVKFLCDTAGPPIGDGRWFNAPYKCWDEFVTFVHYFPVPADATTLTIALLAGNITAGTVYLDRAILALGDVPRDFIQ